MKYKIKKLLLSSLILISSTTHAEMKIYGFTEDFVSCVKSNSEQSDDYTLHGSAESGLLNGQGVIDGSNLDGTYWNYMNCLSKSRGGSTNGTLDISDSCNGEIKSSGGNSFYLPPASNGKTAGVDGYFFKCSSGSWSEVSAVVKNPTGSDRDISPPENRDCSESTFKLSGCTFTLGASKHGYTIEDVFGPKYDVSEIGFEGHVRAICRNGANQVVTSSCLPTSCSSGQEVSWFGKDEYGRSGICSGKVDSKGFASAEPKETKYYSSLEEAKLKSILFEEGSYSRSACSNGYWEPTADSSCNIKNVDELNCTSVGDGFNKRYFCK